LKSTALARATRLRWMLPDTPPMQGGAHSVYQ
jgi:hypothetical protein